MPITIEQVNAADTLNQGRTKWNANDETMKNAINSLEAQQAAHVSQGHPSLYYTKSEVDSAVSTVATNISSVESGLNTHKMSGDHDSRYYTKSEVDSAVSTVATNVSSVESALNTHKTSGDHDSRYYTKNEVNQIETDIRNDMDIIGGTITAHKIGGDHDNRYIKQDQLSTIVRTSGNQDIAGIKNMDAVRVNRIELKNSDTGVTEGRVYSVYDNRISILQRRNNIEQEVLKITKEGYVDFPADEVRSKGKKLATEEYVNSVVSPTSQVFSILYADVAKYVNGQCVYPTYIDDGNGWHVMLQGWFYKKPGLSALKARMFIDGDGAATSEIKLIADDIDLTEGTNGIKGLYESDAGETGFIEITMHPALFSSLVIGYHEWKLLSYGKQSYLRTLSKVLVYMV